MDFAKVVVGALVFGVGFGAVTSLVNAVSHHYADLESEAATISGASPIEIVSVMIDSGWAWAGAAVAVGWLVTRTNRSSALARGAVAGVVALLAATAAYGFVDTFQSGGPYMPEHPVWWVASVVFGAPLGAAGACAVRPGVVGLLARLVVPVGAAVQMVVLPPGRNERIVVIGQTVVWALAAICVGFVVIRFLGGRRSAQAG
ncbi:hypothetical protein [Streptosporangium saharense]|uniref:Uncharacterized protein n=1 Tax=Streptosporangium saharense TaxID=1706840 RepID=A0A7W7QH48_9ACTN|nr:hypothetical protein [Streptosporangium saharense]MBB4913358.1 hypothetical protein [Streptosporangium saharense]